ncbi:putative hydrolase of the HAD superfamily [Nocardiopsis mwathae]|uniref:Putative hydrolase of the HAD superfamily n=1 Tax=Nocardiopsis mwathae TaxID=1472723 RepID=A0A7W9YGU2_9ACTN|nr:HAD family hydrolase [Nocardiopsis mwathae]MBB6171824.1 putative hydrolase of the HAD superfamily [Nocardiopsis mwathae]
MPEPTPTPAVIFFDLDDTLLDDHAASSAGLRALMERLGHPDFQAARRLWDVQTDISFGAYLQGRLSLQGQRRERVRALAVQAGHSRIADEHCDELYQLYLAAHRTAWRPFSDVAPVLDALSAARVGLGVITNGAEAMQREKLATLGITRYFRTIVCADAAGAAKPDPRIFHTACHRMGVAPHQSWHVGDQVRSDALGSGAAGLRAILLDRHDRSGGQEETGVTTIRGLTDLLRLAGVPGPSAIGVPAVEGP